MAKPKHAKEPQLGRPGTAFLLAQVGSLAAMRFAERLREIDLSPPHAGLLRAIASAPGQSQQRLASFLGMVPSRLVLLLDELEQKGLVERRDDAEDRRLYAVHLTDDGAKRLADVARIGRAHDEAFTAALSASDREALGSLLARIAEAHGLTAGVHPGYARLGEHRKTERALKSTRRRAMK